ncbi:MAG: acylphosphatase [Chloroflexi bacterium]|nr:acylphosphatase [Chloroflexota bacterium]MBT7079897.1 acylphosphatase [Chloroflexota bacterium]MBT7290123.1 acylphosphatase [Chloroflexota bacterium]
MAALSATVYGLVQGVGFRYFVRRIARDLDVTGHVRNTPDGEAVEIVAEGSSDKLKELLKCLHAGPPSSRVSKVNAQWLQYKNNFTDFNIRS